MLKLFVKIAVVVVSCCVLLFALLLYSLLNPSVVSSVSSYILRHYTGAESASVVVDEPNVHYGLTHLSMSIHYDDIKIFSAYESDGIALPKIAVKFRFANLFSHNKVLIIDLHDYRLNVEEFKDGSVLSRIGVNSGGSGDEKHEADTPEEEHAVDYSALFGKLVMVMPYIEFHDIAVAGYLLHVNEYDGGLNEFTIREASALNSTVGSSLNYRIELGAVGSIFDMSLFISNGTKRRLARSRYADDVKSSKAIDYFKSGDTFISVALSNISVAKIPYVEVIAPLNGRAVEFNGRLNLCVKSDLELKGADFAIDVNDVTHGDGSGDTATVVAKRDGKIAVYGYYDQQQDLVNFENISYVLSDQSSIGVRVRHFVGINTTYVNVESKSMEVDDMYRYWPDQYGVDIRDTIAQYIDGGRIVDFHGDFLSDGRGESLQNKYHLRFSVNDAQLSYNDTFHNVHKVELREASAIVDNGRVYVDINNASTKEVKLDESSVLITGLDSENGENIKIAVVCKAEGGLHSALREVESYLGDEQKGIISSIIDDDDGSGDKSEFPLSQLKVDGDVSVRLEVDLANRGGKFYPEMRFAGEIIGFVISYAQYKGETPSIHFAYNEGRVNVNSVVSVNDVIKLEADFINNTIGDSDSMLEGSQVNIKLFDDSVEYINKELLGLDEPLIGFLDNLIQIIIGDDEVDISCALQLSSSHAYIPSVLQSYISDLLVKVATKIPYNIADIRNYRVQYELSAPHIYGIGDLEFDKDKDTVVSVSSPMLYIYDTNFEFRYKYLTDLNKRQVKVYAGNVDLTDFTLLSKVIDHYGGGDSSSGGGGGDDDDDSPAVSDNHEIIEVGVEINNLYLQNDQNLTNVESHLIYGAEQKKFTLNGSWAENKGYVNAFYEAPVISIVSNNAGNLLRGLGIYSNVDAGMVDLRGIIDGNKTIEVDAYLRSFNIVNAPVVTELLKLASLVSVSFIDVFNLLKLGKMYFNDLHCGVSYDSQLFTLSSCVANAGSVGVRWDGYVDLYHNNVNFKGFLSISSIIDTMMETIRRVLNIKKKDYNDDDDNVNFVIKTDDNGEVVVDAKPLSAILPK